MKGFAKKLTPEDTNLYSNLPMEYIEALKFIETGFYEEAAQAISPLTENQNDLLLQQFKLLITQRLALKSNTLNKDGHHFLELKNFTDLRIKAEAQFVNGLYFNSCGFFQKAYDSFFEACQLYKKCNWDDKYLSASFNTIICEINFSTQDMTEKQFQQLLDLQIYAEQAENKKILGLIHRQKSYYFKDQSKWRAALFEAELSVNYLETRAFKSDFQLSLLNYCDCALELNQLEKAQIAFERIIGVLDPRVRFAYQFIEFRLNNKMFGINSSAPLSNNQECDPHFLSRYHKYIQNSSKENRSDQNQPQQMAKNNFIWNKLENSLQNETTKWVLTPQSNEGKLFELLIQAPRSRTFLSLVLWPEYSEKSQIESRFYTTISRMNKKYNGIISQTNGKYFINATIEVKTN